MHKLIVLSERQSMRHHIINLFKQLQWSVTILKQTDRVKMNGHSRHAIVLFHLDTFRLDRLKILEQLVNDWQVCVIGDALTSIQMKQIWSYSIAEYLSYQTPDAVIIKKMRQIAQLAHESEAFEPKIIHGIRFNSSQGLISTTARTVHLSKLENELVTTLFLHYGVYLSREVLRDSVWPVGVFASDDALDVLIRRARYKLSQLNAEIVVKRGFGYRLVIQE